MSVFTNSSRSAEPAGDYTAAILGLLGARDPYDVLRATPDAVRRRLAGVSERQLSAPETSGKWSMRQVVRHLADSDLVWGYRLRMVLAHDRPPLTGYDQDLWAERLGYDRADVEQALQELAILRRSNLGLLAAASDEDRQRVGVHAERGEESVEHMVRMYAGHDLLHLQQLDRIHAAVRTTP
jgi:uncharacterized damage-inducible protein DinB